MSSSRRAIIYTVPAELLLKIFHACVEPRQDVGHYHTIDTDRRHRRSVILSHICRVWRVIILGEPALWTDIRLTGVAKLDLLCLQRSRPLPLHLTINLWEMEKKRKKGGNTPQIFWSRILQQPKEVLTRIHSIRATHFRDNDARNMVSSVQKLKLPALSALFIRTTSPDPPPGGQWGQCPMWLPQQLLLPTLTTLELHSRHQTLDGKIARRALEVCKSLTTLILGGFLLGQSPIASPRLPPPVRAPALKRLAVGSPMFQRPGEHSSCFARCPCPFRNLVAEKLEYLELAGYGIEDTIDHLLPLINKRTQAINDTSPTPPPIALVLNSEFASSRAAYEDMMGLPRNIHLHLVNDTSPSLLERGKVVELKVCDWFKNTQSTTLYTRTNNVGNGGSVRAGSYGRPTRSYRYVQRRGGSTAILICPDANASLGLDDAAMEAQGWVLPSGEAYGPYLDAVQPSIEESDIDSSDSWEPTYAIQSGSSGSVWQDLRRDMGWPDGYETPSD